jgi:hypothetical protein
MPFVARSRAMMFEPFGKSVAELCTPISNSLICQDYTALRHNFFNISEAQSKSKIEPNTMRNDFCWKTVTTI